MGEKFQSESPRKYVFQSVWVVYWPFLSNTHFDLFILRIPGSMWICVSLAAYPVFPIFLPTLPRNGLKCSLWGAVARMGTKPVLWESREVFFTVLRQMNCSSREHLSLDTRGERRMQ